MRKRIVFILSLLIISTFIFSETKIGVVNSQDVLEKTQKGSAILKKLEGMQKEGEQKLQAMQKEIQALVKDLKSPALNAEAKEKKQRELEDKQINFKRYYKDAQNQLQQKSQKQLMEFRNDILPIVHQVGKEKGYTLVMDVGAPGVAFFDETSDITPDVIKAVDAKFPAK